MIYILLILEIVMMLWALRIEREDILSPSVIVCMVWTLSTVCAIYNIERWNINIHFNTLISIVIGLLTFIVVSFFSRQTRHLTVGTLSSGRKLKSVTTVIYIPVNYVFLMILILVNLYTVYLQYKWFRTQTINLASWTDMMATYRSTSSTYGTETISKSSLLSNLETLLKITAYITAYIGINNTLIERFKLKNIFLFIPSVLFVIDKILNAGRGDILLFLAAIGLCAYIIQQNRCDWSKKVSKKFGKYLIISLIVVLFLFSNYRTLVGRLNTLDPIEYITYYIGGSVQNFDLFMQDALQKPTIPGEETFANFIAFIGKKLSISRLVYSHHLEFRTSNGVGTGNVYGAFRYYIHDFGYPGLIILTSFVAFFFSKQYWNIKKRPSFSDDGFSWQIMIYMLWAPALFMFSIADYTFSLLTNVVGNIRMFVFLYLVKYVLIDTQFRGLSIRYK